MNVSVKKFPRNRRRLWTEIKPQLLSVREEKTKELSGYRGDNSVRFYLSLLEKTNRYFDKRWLAQPNVHH